MSEEKYRELVRRFVRVNFLFDENAAIDDDVSLIEDGTFDSTGVLEMVTFLEKELLLSVQDEDLTAENFESVSRIVAFAKRISHRDRVQPN